ncbi:uncharacterized protein LOC110000224 [Xyrichtys novacula]|uniref:Uncharacterized protein LOC110000224 n=1 Tax=Xyrichtys novacula TaxID=13765 RepID=A0AAV1HC22_XYRNO|nr:uncharacterized protein LOC110000224 [Xyrichtys novacula]
MALLAGIITVLCAAGPLLSSASPLVVQPGQNISLTCNVTSSSKLTWYLLRSDQLLPLLTVTKTKLGSTLVNFHKDNSRMSSKGSLESGSVTLEILQVEEEDVGIYFCSWSCAEKLSVNKGIHLSLHGVSKDSVEQPCWSLWIYILPPSLVSCFIVIVGLCLYLGIPGVCCCRTNRSPKNKEDASLHYSSLRHRDQLHPSGRGGGVGKAGLVKKEVIYSTVAPHKKPIRSYDC